ncbi:MAG: hypothetical protein HY955_07845 [Deltaproteobacteria bacterium]|nr:hypothetical protein [Deltaproteobacteria bacterium]
MAIDWNAVRTGYEAGVAVRGLARSHGCHESTIRRRAGKEGWERGEAPQALRDEPVHGELLVDHRDLWKGVKKRLVKGLSNNDAKLGLEELKVAKIAGEVLSSVIRGERMAWGLEEGPEATDDATETAAEMARVTVQQGAGEAPFGE